MSDPTPALPSASSPQVLTRALEAVARGLRSTRGLQEALGVDPRTVLSYLHAAEWLGLSEPGPLLTPLGLELVYGGRHRSQVYAKAVWSNPVAARLLRAADGRLPALDDVAAEIAAVEPELAPTTLRRRASAVRSLLAPAIGRRARRASDDHERQLALPLTPAAGPTPDHLVSPGTAEWNAEVYRFVLGALLDHGELALGQLRALLDRAGADSVAIGSYIDMAVTRGDAIRSHERLVITAGAIERRELTETTVALMLTDGGYRAYLDDALASEHDRQAAVRRELGAQRYAAWDRRLFQRAFDAEALARLVLDRPLAAYPVARRNEPAAEAPPTGPFLDLWERRGLVIASPPWLGQLAGGVAAVNRMLRAGRQGSEVVVPDLATRAYVVHAGPFHPGEPPARSVPDARTLRLRVLMHAPYPALSAALLLLHRHRPEALEVGRQHGVWSLRYRRVWRGPLATVLDRFAIARGWLPSARAGRDVARSEAIVEALAAVGIATPLARLCTLAERFWASADEPEEAEVVGRLIPLATALEAWLDDGGAGDPDEP